MTYLLQQIDDSFVAIDESSIAIDGSSVGRKHKGLLLFCFGPTVDPSIAIEMDDLFEENLDLWNHGHKSDPTVDLIKRELPGAIAIKREAPTGGADDVATDVGVDVDVNVNIGDAGAKSGGEHVDDVGGIYGGFTPSRVIHFIED
ncbi:hypothetical protein H5410_000047 [Solanum commersonii]|uniref:Uncharacterized protein n=1 Tax=Solanum commersonii TaxID=4109 RepID=A0A9J6AVP9_SOLCO|nr:hypothetical protein H5410_000047 [Solanum commersonii]